VETEMAAFLRWFNEPPGLDGVVHAALAHLWFVTVHPFDDGNGRIARAIAGMALARSENSGVRFYSLSSQIRRECSDYYASLERAEKGDLDVKQHLLWFIACFSRAIDAAGLAAAGVPRRAEFWQHHALTPFNERQRLALDRFLGEFEGKLTAPKWKALAKCSLPTAQRDLKDLVDRGILVRNPGGSRTPATGSPRGRRPRRRVRRGPVPDAQIGSGQQGQSGSRITLSLSAIRLSGVAACLTNATETLAVNVCLGVAAFLDAWRAPVVGSRRSHSRRHFRLRLGCRRWLIAPALMPTEAVSHTPIRFLFSLPDAEDS
jgi:hypothetical protein